jgi:transposase
MFIGAVVASKNWTLNQGKMPCPVKETTNEKTSFVQAGAKARAVLQVLTGQKSAAQICREFQISESLLSRWKKQFLDGASAVFEKESDTAQDGERVAELERLVGRLTLELEAAKKASQLLDSPTSKRGRS